MPVNRGLAWAQAAVRAGIATFRRTGAFLLPARFRGRTGQLLEAHLLDYASIGLRINWTAHQYVWRGWAGISLAGQEEAEGFTAASVAP